MWRFVALSWPSMSIHRFAYLSGRSSTWTGSEAHTNSATASRDASGMLKRTDLRDTAQAVPMRSFRQRSCTEVCAPAPRLNTCLSDNIYSSAPACLHIIVHVVYASLTWSCRLPTRVDRNRAACERIIGPRCAYPPECRRRPENVAHQCRRLLRHHVRAS